MQEYDTVTEVRTTADPHVAVPLALGSNVGTAVEDLLSMVDDIRYIADVETRHVEKTQEQLMVDATARLTVHLPPRLTTIFRQRYARCWRTTILSRPWRRWR